MQTVDAFHAKTHFSSLLQKVEAGEEIIITKHGRAIARISPVAEKTPESIRQAIAELVRFRKKHTLGELDWKVLRDEGRR